MDESARVSVTDPKMEGEGMDADRPQTGHVVCSPARDAGDGGRAGSPTRGLIDIFGHPLAWWSVLVGITVIAPVLLLAVVCRLMGLTGANLLLLALGTELFILGIVAIVARLLYRISRADQD